MKEFLFEYRLGWRISDTASPPPTQTLFRGSLTVESSWLRFCRRSLPEAVRILTTPSGGSCGRDRGCGCSSCGEGRRAPGWPTLSAPKSSVLLSKAPSTLQNIPPYFWRGTWAVVPGRARYTGNSSSAAASGGPLSRPLLLPLEAMEPPATKRSSNGGRGARPPVKSPLRSAACKGKAEGDFERATPPSLPRLSSGAE